jgi:CSLREA domain-containing protein
MNMRKLHTPRSASAALLVLLLGALSAPVAAAPPATGAVAVSIPRVTRPERPFVVKLRLPVGASALDGRLLVDPRAAELWGVAPVGGGTALRPERIAGGYAFGAYGLRAVNGRSVVRLVVSAHVAGRLQLRVAIDALADGPGRRLASPQLGLASIAVAGASRIVAAPAAASGWRVTPTRAAGATRELVADGRINREDLDAARLGWDLGRLRGSACGTPLEGDANADGCIDIVDLQALLAAQGRRIAAVPGSTAPAPNAAAVTGNFTFTVTSTADTVDATPGNGICADASGACTLRAAMREANQDAGNDIINFNLPGVAPVTIQIASQLPNISSRSGKLMIDGYSQPGSRRNTSTVGSNAVPGVEIRGNGVLAREVAMYIASMGNTIRGLLIDNVFRGILLDGIDAHDNRIIGNWIGFTRTGALLNKGSYGILLNNGASNNLVGTPTLGGRNLVGNYNTAIDQYGAGTNGNVLQNNVLCLRPTGLLVATCNTAIDHNFGPKNDLVGGSGTNERNVIGPTSFQGIEYSHGWNPAGVHGATNPTWELSGNRALRNWVGFRGDGSYDALFRSGLKASNTDNGNAINVYDGSRNNIVGGNIVASVHDGIQVMSANADGNIIRNNVIGVSPLGQAAPLTRWGIIVRLGARNEVVLGNTIRNAAAGGIGLININNANVLEVVATRIRISRNIVSDTSGPAIYLAPDPHQAGSTANGGILPPVFTSRTTSLIAGTARPNATVELYRASRPACLSGLPIAYLGSATAGPDGRWRLAQTLATGDRITALQINTAGNTSQLATNVTVADAPPPPQPGDLIASDAFERTVANGWGTDAQGCGWSLIGASRVFSVSGGAGRITPAVGAVREARLALNTADVNIAGQLSFDRLPAAGNTFAYVVARADATNAYRATVRVVTSGAAFVKLTKVIANTQSDVAAEVNTGVTTTAGGSLGFRLRIVGGHLRFRVWNTTGAEPATWNTEARDTSITAPGSVGLRAYTGTAVPNGRIQVAFDNFKVRVP